MTDNKSMSDLLEANKEVLIINLLDHVNSIEPVPYLEAMVEPEIGLYLPGNNSPIIKQGKYYSLSNFALKASGAKNIKPFHVYDILTQSEDIVNEEGDFVLTAEVLNRNRRHFTTKPAIPVVAINVAISVVVKYLNSLCVYTSVNDNFYNLKNFIKAEYQALIKNEEYDVVFEELLDIVMKFIAKDTWHIYFYNVKGTTIVIQKVIDFRIYQWYQWKLEREQKG